MGLRRERERTCMCATMLTLQTQCGNHESEREKKKKGKQSKGNEKKRGQPAGLTINDVRNNSLRRTKKKQRKVEKILDKISTRVRSAPGE
ncbi:hypothetical protein BOTBODRAFT_386497 [Botryobasidium botryosum FD-172 SS1]|uniref:Uncharacterized protein n=1 Tax=Botryobasidium botryosum (strain FD-172 SS1) TaxID=930990 RepID=A0A067MWF0_BOTB1|nr:hypothetical protein BOTBODRAFT_386497 [Botryobasidium botryosum FD-172 SS1]